MFAFCSHEGVLEFILLAEPDFLPMHFRRAVVPLCYAVRTDGKRYYGV